MSCQRVWDEMNNQERELRKEGFQLKEIWRKTMDLHAANERERTKLENEAHFDFLPGEECIILNIGGEKFETSVNILIKDRWSVLAALCKITPPISKQPDGSFFIDRDWWIFRHIMQFLRNQTLPQDRDLLLELYDEAHFYRLHSLSAAIQSVPGLNDDRFFSTINTTAATSN